MKSPVLVLTMLLFTPCLYAQAAGAAIKSVTLNGHPALAMPLDAQGLVYNVVDYSGTDDAPVLTFHMVTYENSWEVKCRALLSFSLSGIALHPETSSCAKHEFSANYNTQVEIQTFGAWAIPWLHFKNVGHNEYWAFESDPTYSHIKFTHDNAMTLVQRPDNKILILEFLKTAFHVFPKAVDDFWNMRGDVIRPGAEAEFTRQAAAWRMLSVKPALPEVVKTQRMLAEAFLQDKDLATATEHYRLGLKAYPTWPQGWFNLALINGELGNYNEAARDMGFYLELAPDAEDAEAAKMKMLVWAEKAGKK